MNVYDFDRTIFYPDSVVTFAFWNFVRHPFKYAGYMIKLGWLYLLYYLRLKTRTDADTHLNSIVKYVPNFDFEINRFWHTAERKIRKWYLKRKKPDDIIISASPICIVKPMTDKLGVRLFATDLDLKTGLPRGKVMLSTEKVKALNEVGIYEIDNFFSDSLVDTPLAMMAKSAYMVKKNKIYPWPKMTGHVKTKTDKLLDNQHNQ